MIMFFIVLLLVANSIIPAKPWTESDYFKTSILRKKEDVNRRLLADDGFAEIRVRTDGKEHARMLVKLHKDALYSLVCFGGWGTPKEQLAPLYAMFEGQSANIYLCETRTMKQSFLRNLYYFGTQSDTDAIACIRRAHYLSKGLPLIVWGTCAGAFYATRALLELNNLKKLQKYNIKGLIFDSGWGKVDEAVATTIKGRLKEKIAKATVFVTRNKDYRKASERWLARSLTGVTDWITDLLNLYIIHPFYAVTTKKTNLFDTIDQLKIPIFFIHSKDDWSMPLSAVKRLYEKVPSKLKRAWWIQEQSAHSMHHFKNQAMYKYRCTEFIKAVLAQENPDKAS